MLGGWLGAFNIAELAPTNVTLPKPVPGKPPSTRMLSNVRPSEAMSNFRIAPGCTVKFFSITIELMPPIPPGAKAPTSDTSPLAVMGPPAEIKPLPLPSVVLVKPLQSRAFATFALRKSNSGDAPVARIEPLPAESNCPTENELSGVFR